MVETRFIPTKRTAIDGKSWWVVFDTKENKYSTFTCFTKYKTKAACKHAIDKYNENI